LSGASDAKVYSNACDEERILVTLNPKDFKNLIPEAGMSVIGVSAKMKNVDIDKKLMKLMKRLKPTEYIGQYFTLTNES
jgi:hypothetical protein